MYEVDGPARQGALALDDRARQLFVYFKKYNYEVRETGEVIKFVGNYKASRGQAAALVFYVFCGELPRPAPEQPAAWLVQAVQQALRCAGLASTALVLSIAVPFGGSKWYLLTALSPLAGVYYWQRGTRLEEIQVLTERFPRDAVRSVLCRSAGVHLWALWRAGENGDQRRRGCNRHHCTRPGPARCPDMHLQRTLVTAELLVSLSMREQVMGAEEEVERLRRELALFEKGKVPVKGLLET